MNNYTTLVANEIKAMGTETRIVPVTKGDIVKSGIVIGTSRICPTVYTDRYEEEGIDPHDAAIQILELVANTPKLEFNAEEFSDWNQAKRHLKVFLRRKTNNEEDFKKSFLDMEMYVRYVISDEDSEMKSIVVKKDHALNWDVKPETIFKWAINNTKGNATLKGIGAMFFGEEDDSLENEKMIVLSNINKSYGANTLVADKNIIREFCQDYDVSRAYILPSSIHEVLIVPDKGELELKDLQSMVKEVNATQVEPEEQLSDSVYVYTLENDKLKIA